jgi:four helix bundle protein
MHNFKELKIWQKSRELVKICYFATSKFPKEEKFGLIPQIQKASVSIPTNIAEGSGKSSDKDFSRFLEMSISSAFELETLFIVAVDLELIPFEKSTEIISQIQEIQKMIYAFRKSIVKRRIGFYALLLILGSWLLVHVIKSLF